MACNILRIFLEKRKYVIMSPKVYVSHHTNGLLSQIVHARISSQIVRSCMPFIGQQRGRDILSELVDRLL